MVKIHQLCQEEQANIPANYCKKLVEAHLKHLTPVIKLKGNAAKC